MGAASSGTALSGVAGTQTLVGTVAPLGVQPLLPAPSATPAATLQGGPDRASPGAASASPHLSNETRDAVLAKARELRLSGMGASEASRQAVDDLIAQTQARLDAGSKAPPKAPPKEEDVSASTPPQDEGGQDQAAIEQMAGDIAATGSRRMRHLPRCTPARRGSRASKMSSQ